MLKKVILGVVKSLFVSKRAVEHDGRLEKAEALMAEGDFRGAAEVYKGYLEEHPDHVGALNNYGAALGNMGDQAGAVAQFEKAYTLDDTYLPTLTNYAGSLADRKKSDEAERLLRQAWSCEPWFARVGLNYSAICLNRGEADRAVFFQLESWLANFDSLRHANGMMFKSAYADLPEAHLAGEHLLWGETLKQQANASEDVGEFVGEDWSGKRRIRVGYWSPDLRNHSVRYFFRPLLEGHDTEQFEIHVYHDFHAEDAQTELMKAASEHFHDVYELNDRDLRDLMRSHQLDVLVELAGHTSANRLPMLQNRLARVQLSGIGYPPTTGLREVDGKFVDPFILTDEADAFYTEEPFVLPNSFWCFDPKEDALINEEPPVERNGFVTFACVGNIAKMNGRIFGAWRQILDAVPRSRLLIRSISFEDQAALKKISAILEKAGLPLDRIDIKLPEGGKAFFDSYNEIDIILDTYPFNGGTTTCFATYMGVPVVTLYGQSLLSRMGLSIVANLGYPELAVPCEAEYVSVAIKIASDPAYIRRFRSEVRGRFQSSSIGSGKLFASDVEGVMRQWVTRADEGELQHVHRVHALPEGELISRAYKAAAYGKKESAERIIQHCFRHYPNSGGAHLFMAQQLASDGVDKAIEYLQSKLPILTSESDVVAALVVLCNWGMRTEQPTVVSEAKRRLAELDISDVIDRMQVDCLLLDGDAIADAGMSPMTSVERAKQVVFVVACDDQVHFDQVCANLHQLFPAGGRFVLKVVRTDLDRRSLAYQKAMDDATADIVVFMHGHVNVVDAGFLPKVEALLHDTDVVGFAGAELWDRFNWRDAGFARKFGGFMSPADESGYGDVKLVGDARTLARHGLAVLDGGLLAFCPATMRDIELDDEMIGGETLLEEEWVLRAGRSGIRLSAHRNLGVVVGVPPEGKSINAAPARMHAIEKLGLDPFDIRTPDRMFVSVPVASMAAGVRLVDRLCSPS
ncbi:hypothetical protein [Aquabacterium sp.]|uniref:O-linked N-acetylglucosamine transferase, SPINDLY family protein n=1 Tax=Aquabacterium sp. TaxID=1872578 RepID=UPI0035B06F53